MPQGHEQGVILEPGLLSTELFQGRPPTTIQEGGKGAAQKRLLPWLDLVELHQVFRKYRRVPQIRARQQPFVHQSLGINEQGVAGKGGETRIGGVAKDAAGRHQGQKLPVLLLGRRQKVQKFTAAPAKVTDTARPGQGGDMHEQATAPRQKNLIPADFSSVAIPLFFHDMAPCLSNK